MDDAAAATSTSRGSARAGGGRADPTEGGIVDA